MRKADAAMLIRSIARAIKQRFATRTDHDALVQRVEALEQQLADLKTQRQESA